MIVVIMGVAGSGKSTIGQLLAQALGLPFIEGDDFHTPASVEKMQRGTPLSDADRAPWLDRLNVELRRRQQTGAVLACSALTMWSRRRLTDGIADVRFVYLRGSAAALRERLRARTGHFAGAELLDSQLDTLEEPEGAVVVDIEGSLDAVLARVVAGLRDGPSAEQEKPGSGG